MPVFTALRRCCPSTGSTSAIRRMAPRMRWVTAARARSAAPPPARWRPPSPKAWLSCSTSSVEFGFGAVGAHPVVGGLGVVDLRLQLADVGLVGAAGLVVEDRAGGTADVDAAHQLECGHFTSGAGEEHGEIEHPLDVADGG